MLHQTPTEEIYNQMVSSHTRSESYHQFSCGDFNPCPHGTNQQTVQPKLKNRIKLFLQLSLNYPILSDDGLSQVLVTARQTVGEVQSLELHQYKIAMVLNTIYLRNKVFLQFKIRFSKTERRQPTGQRLCKVKTQQSNRANLIFML